MHRYRLVTVVIVLAIVTATFARQSSPFEILSSDAEATKCEKIAVESCSSLPYNLTRLPTNLHIFEQLQIDTSMQEYQPLIDINCSPHLKFFLCSIFTPMCTEAIDRTISSCRSVCESVRDSCSPVLQKFGLPWPDIMNCSRFVMPDDHENLCMEPPTFHDAHTTSDISRMLSEVETYPTAPSQGQGAIPSPPNCNVPFLPLENRKNQCVPNCHASVMFTRENKEFASVWMTIWAIVCFGVTLFTVLTCLLDYGRFPYPERPIIFLAACYNVVALGYIVRLVLGPERISCVSNTNGCQNIIQGGQETSECIIVFILLYYFSMAGAIWWVVLTFGWFLSAGCKWGQEAIEAWSSFFHLAAWGTPAILSIAVLVLKRVDGDELTGLCFVGNTDSNDLLGFVIIPFAVLLCLGSIFMLLGLVSVMITRRQLHDRGTTSMNRFDHFIMRIGVFSLLYFVAASFLIASFIYSKITLDVWQPLKHTCTLSNDQRPPVVVAMYMVKIFMSLVVGITTSMWVISGKTFDTWKRLILCQFCRDSSVYSPVKLVPLVQAPLATPQTYYPSQLRPPIHGAGKSLGSSRGSLEAPRRYPGYSGRPSHYTSQESASLTHHV